MELKEIILVASILIFAFLMIYLQNRSMQPKELKNKDVEKLQDKLADAYKKPNTIGKTEFLMKDKKTGKHNFKLSFFENTCIKQKNNGDVINAYVSRNGEWKKIDDVVVEKNSYEHKLKLSIKAKAKWQDPEYRKKMTKILKNRARNKKGQFKKVK